MSEDRKSPDDHQPQEVSFSQLSLDAFRQVFQKLGCISPGDRIDREIKWQRILSYLKHDERIVARLYYMEGLSMSEIAHAMQLSDQKVHYLHSNLLSTLSSHHEWLAD
ncbi:MAG: hypothetical protein JNM18_19750 [Planctomycetaceae bacterium]|nr:hypothetical protein [Planctomycetaceae bacterium]